MTQPLPTSSKSVPAVAYFTTGPERDDIPQDFIKTYNALSVLRRGNGDRDPVLLATPADAQDQAVRRGATDPHEFRYYRVTIEEVMTTF